LPEILRQKFYFKTTPGQINSAYYLAAAQTRLNFLADNTAVIPFNFNNVYRAGIAMLVIQRCR
jgi:hypothetical protein